MFVSASTEIKLHYSSASSVENFSMTPSPSSSCNRVTSLSLCNDNTYLAILREHEKPQIFSTKERQNIRLIHTINIPQVSCLAFKHTTKKNIALATTAGDVLVYDTKLRTVTRRFASAAPSVTVLDFSGSDEQLCAIHGSDLFVFHDLAHPSSHLINKYKLPAECTAFKCHRVQGSTAILGLKNGHVALWNVQTGEMLNDFDIFRAPITSIALSLCGRFLVASACHEVKISEIDSKSNTLNVRWAFEQEHPTACVSLNSDDSFLAVGLNNGTIKLYDLKKQFSQVYCGKLHKGCVMQLISENKPPNVSVESSFTSLLKLSDISEMSESSPETKTENKKSDKAEKAEKVAAAALESGDESCASGTNNEMLRRLKKNVMYMIKDEMEMLENQLNEHCVKFQRFLDNEFETIDSTIKKKWDVWNMADPAQFMKNFYPQDDAKSN